MRLPVRGRLLGRDDVDGDVLIEGKGLGVYWDMSMEVDGGYLSSLREHTCSVSLLANWNPSADGLGVCIAEHLMMSIASGKKAPHARFTDFRLLSLLRKI